MPATVRTTISKLQRCKVSNLKVQHKVHVLPCKKKSTRKKKCSCYSFLSSFFSLPYFSFPEGILAAIALSWSGRWNQGGAESSQLCSNCSLFVLLLLLPTGTVGNPQHCSDLFLSALDMAQPSSHPQSPHLEPACTDSAGNNIC